MGALTFSALITSLLISSGNPVVHSGVQFEIPKGWTGGLEDQVYMLAPNSVKEPDFFIIGLTGAFPLNDKTPDNALKDFMKVLNKDVKVIDPGLPSKTVKNQVTFINQATQVQDKAGAKSFRVGYLMSKGSQYTITTTFFNKESVFAKYTDDWVALHQSLSLTLPTNPEGGNPVKTGGKIVKTPTGPASGYFPGMPDWVPTGRGTEIPVAKLVNGKPQGIWYEYSPGGMTVRCFLGDGICADNIIYGSGNSVDISTQRGYKPTGVGTFTISGGKISYAMDGKSWSYNYKSGSDSAGTFFSENGGMYRPTRPLKSGELVGLWRNGSTQYQFNSDATFKFGQGVSGSGNGVTWVESSVVTGPYLVDGYLLTTRDNVGHQIIQGIMYGTSKFIILNDIPYFKVK